MREDVAVRTGERALLRRTRITLSWRTVGRTTWGRAIRRASWRRRAVRRTTDHPRRTRFWVRNANYSCRVVVSLLLRHIAVLPILGAIHSPKAANRVREQVIVSHANES